MDNDLKNQVIELKAKVTKLEEQILIVEASIAKASLSSQMKRQRPRELYDATCSDCGNECKIPFKPKYPDKPIYCRECFQKRKESK